MRLWSLDLLRTAGSGCASLSVRPGPSLPCPVLPGWWLSSGRVRPRWNWTHFTRSAMTAEARGRMEKAPETTPGLVESVLAGSGP